MVGLHARYRHTRGFFADCCTVAGFLAGADVCTYTYVLSFATAFHRDCNRSTLAPGNALGREPRYSAGIQIYLKPRVVLSPPFFHRAALSVSPCSLLEKERVGTSFSECLDHYTRPEITRDARSLLYIFTSPFRIQLCISSPKMTNAVHCRVCRVTRLPVSIYTRHTCIFQCTLSAGTLKSSFSWCWNAKRRI